VAIIPADAAGDFLARQLRNAIQSSAKPLQTFFGAGAGHTPPGFGSHGARPSDSNMLAKRLDLLALLLGAAAAAVGGAGVFGYLSGVRALLGPTADTAPIALAESVGLVAGGIAAIVAGLAPAAPFRRAPSWAGLLVGAFALECIVAGIIGADLLIDLPVLPASVGAQAIPRRIAPVASVCFAVLGASLMGLHFVGRRACAIILTLATTACAVLGAASFAGYLLNVEFLVSWPSTEPLAPHAAAGLALLGAAILSAVLHHSKLAWRGAEEARSIELTAVWMLSVFAVAAGVSTFALAQYVYQETVRADLERALRDRSALLEYAIEQHLQQVTIGARPVFATTFGPRMQPRATALLRAQLQSAADALTTATFSGWRFRAEGVDVDAGSFVEQPDLVVPIASPYQTELLLSNGEYFLRTRMSVRQAGHDVAFVLAEDPFPELAQLKLQGDTWGRTGSLVLCASTGAELACLPSRANPRGGRVPREVSGRPLPMSLALAGATGIQETLDLRQQRVLAAYKPIGSTGLAMVIKIDVAELNAPLAQRFGGALALLAMLVAAGVSLLRRRLRPLTRAIVDAREEAARVAAQFRGAAESSLDAYFLMDAIRDHRGRVVDFRIRYMNASGEVLVARPSEDVIGRALTDVLASEQARYFVERYACIVETGTPLTEEFRMSATDASRWIGHQAVKLGDGVSVTARDITRVKTVERQLRSKAENDVLTGLPNRALFFDRLSRALAQARETEHGVGVLFLDVDRFKAINDTHGHAAGDAVLVEFAKRLRGAVRASDTVARLGGDEFAILLPKLDGVAPAERIAADILAAIAVPFAIGALYVRVGTSIGVALSTRHDSPEALVGRADRKLYHAKAAGRGRFSSASERRAA